MASTEKETEIPGSDPSSLPLSYKGDKTLNHLSLYQSKCWTELMVMAISCWVILISSPILSLGLLDISIQEKYLQVMICFLLGNWPLCAIVMRLVSEGCGAFKEFNSFLWTKIPCLLTIQWENYEYFWNRLPDFLFMLREALLHLTKVRSNLIQNKDLIPNNSYLVAI